MIQCVVCEKVLIGENFMRPMTRDMLQMKYNPPVLVVCMSCASVTPAVMEKTRPYTSITEQLIGGKGYSCP